MKLYDFILEGEEATYENAIDHARGQDWQSMTKTENGQLPYLEFKDEVNGVEIWYCFGTDSYLFSDAEDDTYIEKKTVANKNSTIMKKIDEIIGKLTSKQITLEQSKHQVLGLFDVSNSSDLEKELLDGCIVMLETIDLISNKNCC